MEDILKCGFGKLTNEDLGCSEDEFNNFLIELWKLDKEMTAFEGWHQFTIMPKNEIITVVIQNDKFYKKM